MKKGLLIGCAATAAGIWLAACASGGEPATQSSAAGRDNKVSVPHAVQDGDADSDSGTLWTQKPTWIRTADGGYQATGLKSFEGAEEPVMKWVVADRKAEPDDFVNITDQGGGIVRMTLRYRGTWWDGDQATHRRDRQRAEIKGLGPHQKTGETFEYGTTFRTDPSFTGSGRFCHIMQLKATDGSKGAPLLTVSLLAGRGKGCVQYYSGDDGFKVAREFTWQPGVWETVRLIIKTTPGEDGKLVASFNGDPFKGVENLPMYRTNSSDYRPKWGLYRGVTTGMHDDWVEHKDQIAKKLS